MVKYNREVVKDMFYLLKVKESCKESSNDISKRAVIILVNLVELLFT